MVKGIQRQMVIVRTSESEIFELAYFVLRADIEQKSSGKSIIAEANSIVSSVCSDGAREKREKRMRKIGRALLFCAGALCGALVFGALVALVGLL